MHYQPQHNLVLNRVGEQYFILSAPPEPINGAVFTERNRISLDEALQVLNHNWAVTVQPIQTEQHISYGKPAAIRVVSSKEKLYPWKVTSANIHEVNKVLTLPNKKIPQATIMDALAIGVTITFLPT